MIDRSGSGCGVAVLLVSAAGKTVLHLDPNPFYGAHFASLPLHNLTSFLHSQSSPHSPPSLPPDGDHLAVALATRAVYSDVEISPYCSDLVEDSRKFNLDLAGPRVLFCADSAVDLMLSSGASQYAEFKSVDGSFVCGGDGELSSVPDSRSAIFRDTSLELVEKTSHPDSSKGRETIIGGRQWWLLWRRGRERDIEGLPFFFRKKTYFASRWW